MRFTTRVLKIDGVNFPLTVKSSTTINEFKQAVAQHLGFSPTDLMAVHLGRPMLVGTLRDYGVGPKSTIHIVNRFNGGTKM
mmetsp:Transcript_7806/g.14964  ORF Transcript_7806/g.14964 Transcript_7806/m.14964 type:complete len:81 (-) Transcript_7806:789-1031(-)